MSVKASLFKFLVWFLKLDFANFCTLCKLVGTVLPVEPVGCHWTALEMQKLQQGWPITFLSTCSRCLSKQNNDSRCIELNIRWFFVIPAPATDMDNCFAWFWWSRVKQQEEGLNTHACLQVQSIRQLIWPTNLSIRLITKRAQREVVVKLWTWGQYWEYLWTIKLMRWDVR